MSSCLTDLASQTFDIFLQAGSGAQAIHMNNHFDSQALIFQPEQTVAVFN
jgi:hypothetical protein